MKRVTLYHIASGAVLGAVSGPDEADFSPYATAEIGVFDGEIDRVTQYVAAGAAEPRQQVAFSAPSIVTLGEDVTLSGLPDPCWARVDGELFNIVGGSAVRTPGVAREFEIELVGAYRGTATITIKPIDQSALDADPRWQAIQTATPQQIEDWLTTNVTTLASARQVLKVLLLAVRKLGA